MQDATWEPLEDRKGSVPDFPIASRLLRYLAAPVKWAGSKPFRIFLLLSLLTIAVVLTSKVVLDAPIRLQVYVVEVAVIFLLGFVVLEGERARTLRSVTNRGDLLLAVGGVIVVLLWNTGMWTSSGYRASPEPGFADAIALILLLFVAIYGTRNIRPMLAPISLLVLLAGITAFISNEDPTFYEIIGRHFVSLTVWMSAGLLSWQGYAVVSGADYFRILGSPGLTVQVGIRCGGLDVAAIYALLISYFAWQTGLSKLARVAVALGAAIGALILNALRVVLLTILFLNYPPDLIEAVHTNLGDFVFLGYALVFIYGLRKL